MLYDADSLEKDLLEMEPREFYVKHILKTKNWYFSQYKKLDGDDFIDEIDRFREIISNGMGVNFHSVKIVGSAKLGYSLSPDHVLKPFVTSLEDEDKSDIDIAIVSIKMFDYLWDKIRHSKDIYSPINKACYLDTARSIYRGFIKENVLNKLKNVKRLWQEKVNPITTALQYEMSIEHPISYRIYRSWDDIEEYQVHSIYLSKSKKLQEG